MGAFWFIPIGLVIGGVVCDFLVMGRKEITMKSMMVAYALFSAIFAFSAICPIKFLQSAFVGAMEKNNIAPEYIEGMLNITSVPMLVVIVAAGLIGGLLGGFIGQKAFEETLYQGWTRFSKITGSAPETLSDNTGKRAA